MRKQQTNGKGSQGEGGRLGDEGSLVASHGDTVIRECLSNYDGVSMWALLVDEHMGNALHVIYTTDRRPHCGVTPRPPPQPHRFPEPWLQPASTAIMYAA